jgi:hypothetical protein
MTTRRADCDPSSIDPGPEGPNGTDSELVSAVTGLFAPADIARPG